MSAVAAAIGAGGAIVGGLIASGGAQSAADTQAQAANNAAQTQWQIANLQAQLQAPTRQGGIAAENQLLTLLGINPNPTPSNAMVPSGVSGYGAFGDTSNYMPSGALGGGALGGSSLGGTGLGSQYASGLSVNPSDPLFGKYGAGTSFTPQDFLANQDPGYAWRLSQGMKALNQSMAAKGLGISGANIKGAEQYGQNLGSQEYQNAFNRYQVTRANALNPLQSLMGAGQTAANTLTGALGQTGANVSDLQTQAGNARASGYIGSSNAITGALGQIGNYAANAFYNPYGSATSYNPNTFMNYYPASPGTSSNAFYSSGNPTGGIY